MKTWSQDSRVSWAPSRSGKGLRRATKCSHRTREFAAELPCLECDVPDGQLVQIAAANYRTRSFRIATAACCGSAQASQVHEDAGRVCAFDYLESRDDIDTGQLAN